MGWAETWISGDGTEYNVDLRPPNHGGGMSYHHHPEAHDNGSIGAMNHHHCDIRCQRRPAVLMPTEPTEPPTEIVYQEGHYGGPDT